MKPWQGLSISAIRKNEIETTSGSTSNRNLVLSCEICPTSRLQKMAIVTTRHHAANGNLFVQAASVKPREFHTSVTPETARATVGVGWFAAIACTIDQMSVCNHEV